MTGEAIIDWCGFAGAWLLVAGPLYQAVLELREEDTDQHDPDSMPLRIEPPARPSTWWWFLPPVMLTLRRRRNATYHRTLLASLTPHQRAHRDRFIHRATGWLVVALGASFIAIKETYELAEHSDWPGAVLATVLVGMFALVGANTVMHASRRTPTDTKH